MKKAAVNVFTNDNDKRLIGGWVSIPFANRLSLYCCLHRISRNELVVLLLEKCVNADYDEAVMINKIAEDAVENWDKTKPSTFEPFDTEYYQQKYLETVANNLIKKKIAPNVTTQIIKKAFDILQINNIKEYDAKKTE